MRAHLIRRHSPTPIPFAVPDSPFTNVPACRPLLQPLLPVSATGGGRRRCPSKGGPYGSTPYKIIAEGDSAIIHYSIFIIH